LGLVPELRKLKTSVYHPQGNSFLERRHLEISKRCRIHGKDPDQLPENVINYNAKVFHVDDLAVRYIPKSQRKKSDNVWCFVENMGYRNSKTDSIVAKNLQTQRISFLHKDDYKVVKRPSVNFWKINSKYLDVVREIDMDLNFNEFIEPDFNASWKKKNIFVDLNYFQDLHKILDKAKRDHAKSLLFILPEWNESSICKRIENVNASFVQLENADDLCLTENGLEVGKLNFDIWLGYIDDFSYPSFKALEFSSDWGGYVVEQESYEYSDCDKPEVCDSDF
jgi:hypothetical protein